MDVVSFFAGCGGLDLGFRQAGFNVVWANEFEADVFETYEYNHPGTTLCKKDIREVTVDEVPDCDGFIGGPPCQSWSVAGKQRGIEDLRGQLFLNYIGFIKNKNPKFFLIENVKGLLDEKFSDTFKDFITTLDEAGYDVKYQLLDAVNYKVPQNRERVFIIGFRKDLNVHYEFPIAACQEPVTLQQAIGDPPLDDDICKATFGPFYYRGNRRRPWDMPSFTIHATASNIPLHPSSPKQLFFGHEKWGFIKGREKEYRRLSVRECARIQTFPDSFKFLNKNLNATYKMIGNAVPPRLGFHLAKSIEQALKGIAQSQNVMPQVSEEPKKKTILVGYYKNDQHLSLIKQHLIYYVRADGRTGSIFKEDCNVRPKYLLLHNHQNRIVYELQDLEPQLAHASYLKELGFQPTGDTYLCFFLTSASEIEKKIDIPVTFAPFFTEILI